MSLVRWDPARELSSLQGEMNRLFNTFFETPGQGSTAQNGRRWMPAMDLVENETHYVLRADLPGLTQEDVSIEFDANVLTVSGERRTEHEDRKNGWYRLERAAGRFSRSLTLPDGVDADAIEAAFDRGVLEIRIPKPEQRKPRRVAITTGGEHAIEGAETTTDEPVAA